MNERDAKFLERFAWLVAVLALLVTLAVLSSCATSQAMQALPQDWWIGLAALMQAFVEDALSLLLFFL